MSDQANIQQNINNIVPELNNTSSSSIVNRIISVVDSGLSVVELEISNSEQTIENAARSLRVMGKQFYIDTALQFQYGSALTIINPDTLQYGYNPVDTTKQIIKQIAISTNDSGQITIKAAKMNSDGYIEQLADAELLSFADYMGAFTPLGMQIQTVSSEPATLNCTSLYIRYSKEYSFSVIQSALPNIFLMFQSQLRGDDPLYVNDIETAIKSIDGVRDAYFNGIQISDPSEEEPISPTNGIIEIPAGYFNFAQNLVDLTNINPAEPTGTNDIYMIAV